MDSNVAPSKRPRIAGLDGTPFHSEHEVNPLETLAKTAQAASQAEALRRSKQQHAQLKHQHQHQHHHHQDSRDLADSHSSAGPLSTLPQAVTEALQHQQHQSFHHNPMFSSPISMASPLGQSFYGQPSVPTPHGGYPLQQEALWPWAQAAQQQSPSAQHHLPHASVAAPHMMPQSSSSNPMMYLFNPQQSMTSSMMMPPHMGGQGSMPQPGPSMGLPMMQSLQNQVPPHSHHSLPSATGIDDHELLPGPPRRMKNRAVKVDNDTVAWLRANFEPKHGCSLPRRVVYKAYSMHMEASMLEPANAAGFGKLIRSVFPTVTSRRLGSRGNSRYHYDGLRLKPSSAINIAAIPDEDDEKESPEHSPSHPSSPSHSSHNGSSTETSPAKSTKTSSPPSAPSSSQSAASASPPSSSSSSSSSSSASSSSSHYFPALSQAGPLSGPLSLATSSLHIPMPTIPSAASTSTSSSPAAAASIAGAAVAAAAAAPHSLLENGSSSQIPNSTLVMLAHTVDRHLQLPEFPPLTHDEIVVDESSSTAAPSADDGQRTPTPQDESRNLEKTVLQGFTAMYRRHCASVLEAVRAVSFSKVSMMIKSFWSDLPPAILALLSTKRVCDKIEAWDNILYGALLHVLVPEVLRPVGESAHKAIVAFAEEYVASIKLLFGSSESLPPHLKAAKVNAAVRFQRLAKRRMVLNSLAQTGLRMLQSTSQVAQMRGDLERVDVDAVIDDAGAVSGCSRETVRGLMDEFATFVEKPRGLSCASQWLVNIADRFLGFGSGQEHESPAMDSSPDFSEQQQQQQQRERSSARLSTEAAHKFLMAWTYYTSQVLRELVATNASSFGSFNALRMLFDEYMHYIVEVRLHFPGKVISHPDMGATARSSGLSSAPLSSSSGSESGCTPPAFKSAKRLAAATSGEVPHSSDDLESRSVRSMDCSGSAKEHPSGASSMSGSDWSTSPHTAAMEEEGEEEEQEEEEEEEEEDSFDETPRQNKRKSSSF